MFTTRQNDKPRFVALVDEGDGKLRLQVEGYNILEFKKDGTIRRVGSVDPEATRLRTDGFGKVVFSD